MSHITLNRVKTCVVVSSFFFLLILFGFLFPLGTVKIDTRLSEAVVNVLYKSERRGSRNEWIRLWATSRSYGQGLSYQEACSASSPDPGGNNHKNGKGTFIKSHSKYYALSLWNAGGQGTPQDTLRSCTKMCQSALQPRGRHSSSR